MHEQGVDAMPSPVSPRAGRMLFVLDLLGVAVFAISGALAAMRLRLDLFGVVVLAAVTAIGGGTLRDLLTDRHPVFWIADPRCLYVILGAVAIAVLGASMLSSEHIPFLIADALGLGLFAISGAQTIEQRNPPWIVTILMGTMTGVAGGVVRDILSGIVPMLLRRDIYATAAIAGVFLYLVMQKLGVPRARASIIAMFFIVALRLLSVAFNWQLPVFKLPPP
jgi:uncharacterized membrane protein YeiH